MKHFFKLFLFFIIINLLHYSHSYSQVELVPPSHRIYDFLDRMNINKIIENYSSSIKPISRREIAKFLNEIKNKKSKLSRTDKKFLEDFNVEFEYDINRSLKKASSFFSDLKFSDIFRDKKQKYLYANADSNSSIFWDALGEIRYIGADGDSLGKPHVLLGQLGTRLRGTLFNSVGYYIRISNGVRLGGNNTTDPLFAAQFDPVLASTRKFVSEGSRTYDSFEGHLRYAPSNDWLGLTAGREALKFGTGFIDKLIVSNNSAPFDFLKLDLSYKKIKYTFFHSSIVGNDTAVSQLESKYFVYHRLEIGPMFSGFMRLGFNEMVIYSNIPINFAFLNPIAFLTSADLNTELPGKNSNNTLIGIDAQFFPVKKLSLQTSLLIDDLNFETLGDTDSKGNDNKFAYQAGISWEDAFTLNNLNLMYEFTHIDPFVYSHRQFNNSYAHWNQPLGHFLNPNSDEHAFKLSFNFGSRLNLSLTYKLQRSGMNFIDTAGQFINVGSNILDGRGDFLRKNVFLEGTRVNRNILTAEITWQPIRQYYFSVKFQNRTFDYIDQNRNLSDNIFLGSFRVDY
ncbi:MAG: capsule assembly Wzi family protein [Ignavibacteria bacterium]